MKKIVLLFVVLICLQVAALAVPDSAITGPYKISFDLNKTNGTDYNIKIDDMKTTETLSGDKQSVYGITIASMTDPSKTISITLINDEKVRESTTQPTLELALKQLINSLSGRNIETATRLIDSTQGSVASFDFGPIKGYAAIYFPTIDPKHLEVALLSTYLWDEGTLQLLKTIHITKI